MNILFLSSDYPPYLNGGVGTYTHQLAKHLARRNHGAFVITEAHETPCEYVEDGIRVWRVRPEKIAWFNELRKQIPKLVNRFEYSKAVAQQLKQIVKRYSIDAVESCESRAEGFWYYLFHQRPKLFIKLHTPDGVIFDLNQEPPSLDLNLILKLEEWWLRKAHTLIGLTRAMTQRVGKLYQLKTETIPKVGVPVDTDFFLPNPDLRSKASLQVLYVGRLEFRKGIHVLLRALPRILKEIPDVQFRLIGRDCGMKPFLEKRLMDPKYRQNIRWQEFVSREELREAYQQSHISVVPSLWENHPAVCLEGMSSGCAVVASGVGGIPEIIQHGLTGCLVPAGSSVSLAKAVIELARNRPQMEAMGKRARLHVEQNYATDKVLDDTLAVYERLLQKKNHHVPSYS